MPRIKRKRVDAEDIFTRLGPTYSRGAYRMHVDSFHRLHKLLHKHDANLKLSKRRCDVNGPTSSTTRLSMALRYFAKGEQVRYWVSP